MDGTLTVAAHDFAAIRSELGLAEGRLILEELEAMPRAQSAPLYARLDELELELARAARPAPGAMRLLQILSSAKSRLGIVTRNSHANAIETLRACGLDAFFRPCCIFGRESAPPKPDPSGVRALLAHWDQPPMSAVMVGDYLFDLQAGRAAGTVTAYVDLTGEFPFADHADVQVRDLDALRAELANTLHS
jgi:HAD superfamily hydrolase (TIGR01509 family)